MGRFPGPPSGQLLGSRTFRRLLAVQGPWTLSAPEACQPCSPTALIGVGCPSGRSQPLFLGPWLMSPVCEAGKVSRGRWNWSGVLGHACPVHVAPRSSWVTEILEKKVRPGAGRAEQPGAGADGNWSRARGRIFPAPRGLLSAQTGSLCSGPGGMCMPQSDVSVWSWGGLREAGVPGWSGPGTATGSGAPSQAGASGTLR